MNYGVSVNISARAARPISIQSTTPIGIAGTVDTLSGGLYFFGSVSAAIEGVKSADGSPKESGSIVRALKAIDEQAVETPIILSVFEAVEGDLNATLDSLKTAIELFRTAKSTLGYRPNVIVAPEFSHEDVVASALQTAAEKLRATAIVDLNAADESEAVLKAANFGTRRVVLADPFVKVWLEGGYAFAPQSARIAGMIAKTDGESEYGWSDSYSNRVMNGIFGGKRAIEFVNGEDCEANRLRTAHISTIINQSGWRSWGGETSDIDSVWQDLARVRIFDRISEACQEGVFYAIDKKADQLYYARRSVEELLRNLKGSKVLIGYDVKWSEAKNTQATVTAGKFYLDIYTQNNPIVKQLELDFIYSDSWSDELLSALNKA